MKEPLIPAREALLHSNYGKFDLIVAIIPKELLHSGKPRRVKEWLVKNLQVKRTTINENTLRSWLYRYRKSQQKNTTAFETQHWQEFEPSIPKPEPIHEKLIIKKVAISKNS